MRGKFAWILIAALSLPVAVGAAPSKEVRDRMTQVKLDEHVAATVAQVKTSCGVGIKFEIEKASFLKADAVAPLLLLVDDFGKFAAKYCSDADSKKEFATIKVVKVKANPGDSDNLPEPTLDKAGTLTILNGTFMAMAMERVRKALDAAVSGK